MTTPSQPGTGYVLDWESASDRVIPPLGWGAEYDAANARPQIGFQRRHPVWWLSLLPRWLSWLIRRFRDLLIAMFGPPPRSGTYCIRFDVASADGQPKGPRAELAAEFEPADAERWYGFSILLTRQWKDDPQSAEILTQWHQDWNLPAPYGAGSPPLALETFNGQWQVSQHWENHEDHVLLGAIDHGRWTDWIVHARWSSDDTAQSPGLIEIWKNGQAMSGTSRVTGAMVSFAPKPGKNTYVQATGQGNYMKIGIYKWAWDKTNPKPFVADHRVADHDEVRIADGQLLAAAAAMAFVAPRGRRP